MKTISNIQIKLDIELVPGKNTKFLGVIPLKHYIFLMAYTDYD